MTIFLLLSLVLVLSTESMAATPSQNESMAAPTVTYEYDELRLAFQWPTSYCNAPGITCNCIPLEFKVHGLWPNPHSHPFLTCNTNPIIKNLDRQMSPDLRNGLKVDWPNLNSRTPPGFLWDHEYQYHGYCFRRFADPQVYFQTGLHIAANIIRDIMPTIYKRLRDTQTPGLLHRVEDLRIVTIAGQKLILGLRCNYARNGVFPQLLDIVFCTHINGEPKNCSYYVDKCYDKWGRSGWFQFPSCQSPACQPRCY